MKSARRRSRQLIVEAIIFAFLFLLIIAGGSYSALHIPTPWADLQNPAPIKQQSDLSGLAVYFNSTLSNLGEANFANVSATLYTFPLLNIPSAVSGTASQGVSQISAMNVSIPIALTSFREANQSFEEKQYGNASLELSQGCQRANTSAAIFSQFENSTTPNLSRLGVPVSLYSVGADLVQNEISSLIAECKNLRSLLSPPTGSGGNNSPTVNFTISSPQRAIQTGGIVVLNGNLVSGNVGLEDQNISFYFNGTFIGSTLTTKNGSLHASFPIKFVYAPVGVVWAAAGKNTTIQFSGIVSNYLFFTILFNETQIIVGDPPAYLPTSNFTVNGNLSTKSGVPLPAAPVKITFFNQSFATTTDTAGIFRKTLTVPANATDGVAYVYAAFAPQGSFGPSFNLTSILVYHEPMNLTINPSGYSFAGFYSVISGKIEANNSALANAHVNISSPWGNYPTVTDSSGSFSVNTQVPLWDFAFSGKVAASAFPPEAYIAPAQKIFSISILNLLWLNVPVIAAIVTIYEVGNLGLVPKMRTRLSRRAAKNAATTTIKQELPAVAEDFTPQTMSGPLPRLIAIYKEALALAAKKFGLSFRESSTIRERIRFVQAVDPNPESSRLFSSLSLVVEDYLYAASFDQEKIRDAEDFHVRLTTIYGSNAGTQEETQQ